MSILSNFLSNTVVGRAVQAVAKPFISKVPVVGDYVNSRILMAPRPAEGALEGSTSQALQQFQTTVRSDPTYLQQQAGTGAGAAVTATHASTIAGLPRDLVLIGASVLVFVLLLFIITRKRK